MFREGLPGWIAAGYPTKTIAQLPEAEILTISTGDLNAKLSGDTEFILLDIRTTVDRKFWIEDGRSLVLDLNELNERWASVPTGKEVVVLDLNGKRSPIAARFLHGKGYTDIVKVSGGIVQYLKDGYPVKSAQ